MDHRDPDKRRGRHSSRSRGRSRSRSRNRNDAERIQLPENSGAVAYLLGRNGATKLRLSKFSGCEIDVDTHQDAIEIHGTVRQRALARLAVDITLQQRNGGRVRTSFEGLECRPDTVTIDVPVLSVGFVLGTKGATLREMETRRRTFMFFDNDTVRMYPLSSNGRKIRLDGQLRTQTKESLSSERTVPHSPPSCCSLGYLNHVINAPITDL